MSIKTSLVIIATLIIASAMIGWYLYPVLPPVLVSHWGANGTPNGHMPKLASVILLPIMMIVFTALFSWLPKIDPLKKNVAHFRKSYNALVTGIIAFLFYVNTLSLIWNVGFHFDMKIFILPVLGALFFGLGVAFPRTKRNWFMGIRTPWTLSSDRVWEETHRFGGTLFKIVGIITALSVFGESAAYPTVLASLIFATIAVVVYSYVSFKR